MSVILGTWIRLPSRFNRTTRTFNVLDQLVGNGMSWKKYIDIGQNEFNDNATLHVINSIEITVAIDIPKKLRAKSQQQHFDYEMKDDRETKDEINSTDDRYSKDDSQIVGQCWVEFWYPIRLIEPRNVSDMTKHDLKTIRQSNQFIHSAIRTKSIDITQNQVFNNKQFLKFSWDCKNESALSQFHPILNNFIHNSQYFGHYCVNNTIKFYLVIEMFSTTNNSDLQLISSNNGMKRLSEIETTIKYDSSENIEYPFTNTKYFKSDFDDIPIANTSSKFTIDFTSIVSNINKRNHEKAAIEFNKSMNIELMEEKKVNERLKKLLLVGSRNSGQSGVFARLTRDYLERDRIEFKDAIYLRIIQQMKLILENMDLIKENEVVIDDFVSVDLELSPQGNRASQIINEIRNNAFVDENIATNIEILWKEGAVQQIFEQGQRLGIDDSCSYYFNEITRIGSREYMPTDRVCSTCI